MRAREHDANGQLKIVRFSIEMNCLLVFSRTRTYLPAFVIFYLLRLFFTTLWVKFHKNNKQYMKRCCFLSCARISTHPLKMCSICDRLLLLMRSEAQHTHIKFKSLRRYLELIWRNFTMIDCCWQSQLHNFIKLSLSTKLVMFKMW